MSMDWMPTLMDIVGAKKNELLDGVSLWPGIQGKDDSNNQDRTLLWVRREGGTRYGGQDYYAIRKERGNYYKIDQPKISNCSI